MWGRFPHVVLLIFTNIIFKVSCKGNGSLTFVIDETSSMKDDIFQVRRNVNRIKNIVLHEKSSLINNMVLVTFNDPGVYNRIVTKNPDTFKKALYTIKAHNEAKKSDFDCWEPSMKGLLQALNKSQNNSYVFVFTDASSKDYINGSLVIEMCQKKQTQIVFVLTGTLCAKIDYYPPAAVNVYFDIAVACTGLVIIIPKNKVNEVFRPIEEIIKGNKAVITSATVPAGISKNIGFVIDNHTDYVIVTANGQNVTLKINGHSFTSEKLMSTDNTKMVKIYKFKPGKYIATVKSKSTTYISVVGRTEFFFVHGFSKSKPKSLSDTSPQPKPDTKVYLSIFVTDKHHSVKIVAAKILDMNENLIKKELPLKNISKNFYITDRFVVPSQMFKVVVDGIVIASNKKINRTAKIPVTPVLPPQKIAPKLHGASVMHVKHYKTAVLKCKVVSGSPPPKITWLFRGKSGSKFIPLGRYGNKLRITNVKIKQQGKYKCVAENDAGKDEHVMTLYIQEAPHVAGVIIMKVRRGASASINCTVTKGEPKPSLTWRYAEAGSTFSTIPGSDKVLHIPKVKSSHAGRYKCVAQNRVGSSEHITTLEVQEPPEINSSHSAIYRSTEGDALLRIPCVAGGLPKPSITWKLNDHVINPNAKYSMQDGALIIRDPKVTDTNSYTCEAKNEAGVVRATFKTYIYQVPQVSGVTLNKVKLGTPASIQCTVDKGKPKPSITWRYTGNDGSTFSTIPGSDEVLHISKVESSHAGRYKCVAQNRVGSSEHITTLEVQVQDPPNINSSHSDIYRGTEGDALLRIPCVAGGLPKPSITWKLNDQVINPNAKYSMQDEALIIRDPKVTDTNLYTCEAKNEAGVARATFKTYIYQVPQVSGVTFNKVKLGTPASIQCTVDKGKPKPSITWRYTGNDGSTFSTIPGSDEVLHISKVESSHAGRYKCVAQNRVGSSEHITTLEVQDPPNINSSHSDIYRGTEGDALLRIPCVAGGLPKPSITWKLNDQVINPNAKYSMQDEALIIRDPKVTDTNSYTCEAKNEAGVARATFKTYIYQVPQVSGVTFNKVKLGTPASIQCTVDKGKPKPSITWRYTGNDGSTFSTIPGSDEVLHISKVESSHAGRYKCVAQNRVGSSEHITTLEVQDPPNINSSHSDIYRGTEGDALLRIPCVAGGLPKPSITWKLNDQVINPNAKYSIEDEALIIRDPKANDTNSYTCEAKNELGVVNVTFRAFIRQAPQVSEVTLKKVQLGMPTSIECTVKGHPEPVITWQFRNNSGSEFLPVSGSKNILHISNAENSHAGLYKCVAQNSVSSNEQITTLIVESLPGITTKPTTVEGIEGDLALRLPCDVVGIPQPIIAWSKNGSKIAPDEKYLFEDGALVIVNPTKNDSASYTCEAKNHIGSVSTSFQAVVEEHPKSFGTEHYVYLLLGETRQLKCEANSSKSDSVKWFLTRTLDPSTTATTTSSLLQIDLTETTTQSRMDFTTDPSTTTRTSITDDGILQTITSYTGVEELHFQIVNASYPGNYTCRVNDKHGNTQTNTYVVNVGNAPVLRKGSGVSISNWEGDVTDITRNCDLEDNNMTKPTSEVEWTFNGDVITDFNSAGVGHYTCNVSNVYGSDIKKFDVNSSVCLITRNLKDAQYMPVILNGKSWHKLKNTEHYFRVEQEAKITLSCGEDNVFFSLCPNQTKPNAFKNFPNKSTLEAFCYKEDSFIIDDKIYKLSDLQCTNTIQPSVIRDKVKCSTETSELIRVGYNIPDFLEAYEVCFDYAKHMPSYIRIIMSDANNNGLSADYSWFTYPGIDSANTNRGFTCKDSSSSCCYSKSQLVNAIDFNDGPAKKSTFIDPLNAIPVWRPCNASKPTWEIINDKARSLLAIYNNILAWSGTHTLQEINGAILPRYLWKVLRFGDDRVAIVNVNDPTPTEKDIKCKSNCSKYNINFSDKHNYCCSLSEFVKEFDIHNIDFESSLN